jgi:AraC-like DNA-binding protein
MTNNPIPAKLQLTDISSNHLTLLSLLLEREGSDLNTIFSELGVDVPTTNNPVDRVPLVAVIHALEQIREITRDPCSCMKLYQHMKLAHLNTLGFALSCSSSLLDFFQRTERFCAYIGSAFLISIEERDDHYWISGGWNPSVYEDQLKDEPNANLLLECFGYSALGMLKEVYLEPLPIRAISLVGDPDDAVIAAFGQTSDATIKAIKTGASMMGVELDKEVVTASLPGANPQLAREIDQMLLEHLEAIGHTDIVHRCERLIIGGMPVREFNLKTVARKLGMSERVLQRNLRAQGQSFSQVVSRIKKTLAMQYLDEGKKNVDQIAYALGFDSPSNFSRAFRNWTGYSPREYKNRKASGTVAKSPTD